MATVTRQSDGATQAKVWFVRNEQGGRFGPVDFETLKAWACDGRIGPTNEVSNDGKAWQLAPLLRSLEMEWVAEVTPGNYYGPIHLSALRGLVADGSISKQAVVFRKASLSEEPAEPVMPPAETGVPPEAKAVVEIRRVLDDRDAQLRQAQGQAEALRAELGNVRQQSDAQAVQLRRALEQASASEALVSRARQELTEQDAQSKRVVSALEAQLQDVRQQVAAGELVAAGLREELARQTRLSSEALNLERAKVAELEKRLADSVSILEETRRQMGQAEDEHQARSAEWEALRLRMESESRSLRDDVARALSATAERTAKIAELESALAEARGMAAMREEKAAESLKIFQAESARMQTRIAEQALSLQAADAQNSELRKKIDSCHCLHEGDSSRLDAVNRELQASRQEVSSLRDAMEALRREMQACESRTAKPEIEVLEAEILEEAPRVQAQPKRPRVVVEAEILPPADEPAAEKAPPSANASGRGKTGLSLAELEQQARRELERLGSHGHAFFMKKK